MCLNIIQGRVRGPLFNLKIADGSVFGRDAYVKTPESQRFHSIREPWGLELGIEYRLSFFVRASNKECLLSLDLEYPTKDNKTVVHCVP